MMRGRPMTVVTPDQHGPSPVVRHVMPWALLVVLLGAGGAGHLAWSGSSVLPLVTAALAVITGGLVWLGWTVARARRVGPAGRAHVAATVGVAGVWLLLAIVAGPFARPVVDVWGLVGTALAVSWNLRLALHGHGGGRARDEDDDTPGTPRAAGRRLMQSLGIRGAQMDVREVTESRAAGRLELTDGQTADEIQKRSGQIASALGIGKSAVRITEDPEDASHPEFSLTLVDVFRNAIVWAGPTAVGGTAMDPIPMGMYDTGDVLVKTVVDGAGAKHELIQGTTGAGKSSGSIVEFCELMTRREVSLIVVDFVKKTQTFGRMASALEWLIMDQPLARKFLRRLRDVVSARTAYLGAKNLSEWVPGCGINVLVVLLEEAAEIFEEIGEEDVLKLLRAARSAGVIIKISLQRPSHDQINTTTRTVLNSVTCYGMHPSDSVCMLPDDVLDAGASPVRWGDRHPGCCYVSGVGITTAQAATPVRTYMIDKTVQGLMADHFGPLMTPLDSVTTRAFGDLWTGRERPTDAVARVNRLALEAAGELRPVLDADVVSDVERPAPAPAGVVEHHDQADEDADPLTEDDMHITTPDPDPSITADIDEDLEPAAADLQFGAAPEYVDTDTARAAVADRIAQREAAGADTVRAPDLKDLVLSGMRARSWFRKELERLVVLGRLQDTDDPGVYRIVPAIDRGAA